MNLYLLPPRGIFKASLRPHVFDNMKQMKVATNTIQIPNNLCKRQFKDLSKRVGTEHQNLLINQIKKKKKKRAVKSDISVVSVCCIEQWPRMQNCKVTYLHHIDGRMKQTNFQYLIGIFG